MANIPQMSQPARFWAFVEELEGKGARPSESSPRQTSTPKGAGRGMRGLGRGGRGGRGGRFGGRRARMQHAMSEMQNEVAHEAPEEMSSDEDGFTPIMTPVEPISEKQALLSENAETENERDTENEKPRRGGMGRGKHGRRGQGPFRGRGGFGGRGMGRGCAGCHGMPGARPGAVKQHPFGPRRGPRGGSFKMGGMRKALNNENSSSDERKPRGQGIRKRGMNGVQVDKANGKKPGVKKAFKPRADILDSSSSYIVNVALPGAKKDNIKVIWRSKRGVLVVRGRIARKTDDLKQSHTIAQRERVAGMFKRRVPLSFPSPANVDADRIVAKLEDGVLRVDVPKMEREKPFSGPVKVAIV